MSTDDQCRRWVTSNTGDADPAAVRCDCRREATADLRHCLACNDLIDCTGDTPDEDTFCAGSCWDGEKLRRAEVLLAAERERSRGLDAQLEQARRDLNDELVISQRWENRASAAEAACAAMREALEQFPAPWVLTDCIRDARGGFVATGDQYAPPWKNGPRLVRMVNRFAANVGGKGWISPKAHARVQAEAAALREALQPYATESEGEVMAEDARHHVMSGYSNLHRARAALATDAGEALLSEVQQLRTIAAKVGKAEVARQEAERRAEAARIAEGEAMLVLEQTERAAGRRIEALEGVVWALLSYCTPIMPPDRADVDWLTCELLQRQRNVERALAALVAAGRGEGGA